MALNLLSRIETVKSNSQPLACLYIASKYIRESNILITDIVTITGVNKEEIIKNCVYILKEFNYWIYDNDAAKSNRII